jgi:hypothetical protein
MYVIVVLPFLGLSAAAALDIGRELTVRYRPHRPRLAALGTPAVAAAVPVLFVAALAVAWVPGLRVVAGSEVNGERAAAERWIEQHVPSSSVVLTDDVTWLRLVRDGVVPRQQAIWFYKLDTDSEITKRYPGGWRDVDLVVATSELRQSVAGNPALVQSAAVLAHSRTVAEFGEGAAAVQIRQVLPDEGGRSS